MNRKELEELGLEPEQIEAVMKAHGSTVNATKEELDAVTTDRDALKEIVTDRDSQLESLKGVDAEGLQAEIERLKSENEATATEYQAKLDGQRFDFTLDKSLSGAKARNAKAVRALLKTEDLKMDGDKILNLDDQLKALQESDPYLFEAVKEEEQQEEQPAYKPSFSNGEHGTKPGGADPFADKLAKYKQKRNDIKWLQIT